MAEEKDFSVVEGRDPSTWSSFGAVGREYRKFLLDAEENNEKSKLTSKQKDDLKALMLYEEGSEKSDDKNQVEYDESEFTAEYWSRLQSAYDVSFYLSYPQWALSDVNKQLQAYIENEYFKKGKSMVAICNNARKKIGLPEIGCKSNPKDKTEEQQNVDDEQQEQQPKKKGFLVLLERFTGNKQQKDEKFNQNEEDIKREANKLNEQNKQNAEEQELEENERVNE